MTPFRLYGGPGLAWLRLGTAVLLLAVAVQCGDDRPLSGQDLLSYVEANVRLSNTSIKLGGSSSPFGQYGSDKIVVAGEISNAGTKEIAGGTAIVVTLYADDGSILDTGQEGLPRLFPNQVLPIEILCDHRYDRRLMTIADLPDSLKPAPGELVYPFTQYLSTAPVSRVHELRTGFRIY